MSEFSLSCAPTKKKTEYLSSLVLSDFMLFCSFIFISPYLFKILYFLSPLFFTTSLLLLALFTLTPTLVIHGSHLQITESKASFLLTTYQTLVETLLSKESVQNDELGFLEALEAYKMVFETSTIEIQPDADEDSGEMETKENLRRYEPVQDSSKLAEITQVKSLVAFFQEKEKQESLPDKKGEKEVKPPCAGTDKGDEQKEKKFLMRGSKTLGNEKTNQARSFTEDPLRRLRGSSWDSENGEEKQKFSTFTESYCQPLKSYSYNLGNFGSMRREKEWKRTLGCKLFEERNNGDGGEGMDLLWETYETGTNRAHHQAQLKSGSKKGKKGRNEERYHGGVEDDDDEGCEEESDGQLCCLQALKFSAGKMNLGMGRPSLVKISKAIKGVGWLHHVGSRHGKKGYH